MALTDTKLRTLKPGTKAFQVADGGGLFMEVMPGGKMVWRMRYRLAGKQEKVTLGEYPFLSLAGARGEREKAKMMIYAGESPMQAKQGEKREAKALELDTVETFGRQWLVDVVEKTNDEPRNVRRVLEKDVFPFIGGKPLSQVAVGDVLSITDRIKARSADASALLARNVLKRMFSYAIAREKMTTNPAAAVQAQYIATARSRDVALTSAEVGRLLRGVYVSSMRRSHKLAVHLLILCMVRKSELIEAQWHEIDVDKAEWVIPGERMKKDKPHTVYLSRQALELFQELRGLACGSPFIIPSRGDLQKPISKSTLNAALRSLNLDIQSFVIHDFRRTASTHLNEAGFNSDVVEKALAHEQGGVRGVYNRAQYAEPRRKMLQWWSDFVGQQVESKVITGQFGGKAA